MTLIEVVISVGMIGLLAVTISTAIVVVLRTAPTTEARIEAARWEQNLGTWLPADLTSADSLPDISNFDPLDDADYPTDPAYPPPAGCGDCAGDINVLQLSWDDGTGAVEVSYRYGPAADGSGNILRRVSCTSGVCQSIILVRGLVDSGGGLPPIKVTFPPDVLAEDPNTGSPVTDTSARSVTVTITSLLADGGTRDLSFTGGGAELVDLIPAAIEPPKFLQASSDCGGPITLIVDGSGSLTNSDRSAVRAGVKSFVSTFAGTPTQLQIVRFSAEASVLGGSGSWNYWYDLSEPSVVAALLGPGSDIDDLGNSGATNWEDALYRAFYTENGDTYASIGNPARPPAELVVFFTDGMPTYHRDNQRADPGQAAPEVASSNIPSHFRYNHTTVSSFTQFSPRAWFRASWLLQQNATSRVIGVGVGTAFSMSANLDRDTTISDEVIDSDWSAPYGPADGYSDPRALPAQVALGDLIAGNDLSTYSGTTIGRYTKVEYDAAADASSPDNNGWDPDAIKTADILTTTDMSKFGGALESIALAECGGTLSVQTRRASDQAPIPATVEYQSTVAGSPAEVAKTTAVAKTAVFKIASTGQSQDVTLAPLSLPAGYTADHWECRQKNALQGAPKVVPVSGDVLEGIKINVEAIEAVSCVLFVN